MTNSCEKCKVDLASNLHFCPLCGAYIVRKHYNSNPKAMNTVNYKHLSRIQYANVLQTIIIILGFAGVVLGLMNSTETGINWRHWWVVSYLASLALANLILIALLKKSPIGWREMLATQIFVIAYIVFIDWYIFDLSGFSISYAIAGIIIATCVLLTILSNAKILSPIGSLQAFSLLCLIASLTTTSAILLNILYSSKIVYIFDIAALMYVLATTITFATTRYSQYVSAVIKSFRQ